MLPTTQAIQGIPHRLKEGLRQVIQREPAELGEGFRFRKTRFLVADFAEKLNVQIMPAIGDNVRYTEKS